MTNYCKENVICVNNACKERHYKTFEERLILSQLIKPEEMTLYMEEYKPSMPTCRYHLLCFERECVYNHSQIALDGRKFLIKAFKNHVKHEKAKTKIETDIANIRAGQTSRWEDMTKC
jgi:hypothetical protein